MARDDAARASGPGRTAGGVDRIRGTDGVTVTGGPGEQLNGSVGPRLSAGGAVADDRAQAAEETVPVLVLKEFLRRLHDGPMQELATLRVALTVWQQAIDRDDAGGAAAVAPMVQDALQHLITGLSTLQETGRQWAGGLPLDFEERRRAAAAVQAWAARTHRS